MAGDASRGVSAGSSATTGREMGELGSSNIYPWLSGAERDDSANRIVGGNAHGDAVSRHHLDAEPAHPPAQLGKHFMSRIALHSVESATVHRHYRSLHVDQIVFTQTGAQSFLGRERNALAMIVPQNEHYLASIRTRSSTWLAKSA